VFRLLVSSTFSDFIAEREALRTRVFPELERFCAARGARFEAIDLRWGITEDAQRDHDTMRICLEEVRRCQQLSPRPNFAVLLGDRYGWEPVPARIPRDHWRRLRAAAVADDWALIERSYRLDLNAVPPVYCLKPRKAPRVAARHEARLLTALRRAARSFRGAARLPYFASATHQEIALGALTGRDEAGRALQPEQHVQVYVRRLGGLPEDASAREFIDWDEAADAPVPGARDRLRGLERDLRQRLGKNVHEFHSAWVRHGRDGAVNQSYLSRFCAAFLAHQRALIEAELADLEDADESQEHDCAHRRFGAERARVFAGRAAVLANIERYVTGVTRGRAPSLAAPLILVGDGGSGKSALLARAAQDSRKSRLMCDAVMFQRYIGGVPGSESLMSTLIALITDISRAYDRPAPPVPEGAKALAGAFVAALSHANARKPLIVYLDALDQFDATDSAWMLEWLPKELPRHARLVASVRTGVVAEQSARRRFPESIVELAPMKPAEGRAMLDAWLADKRSAWFNAGVAPGYGRRLTAPQRHAVLQGFAANGSPLWLKLAYEDAAAWASWQKPRRSPVTVHGIITEFIERKLLGGESHPRRFTERALAYLTAGRFGLSEKELGRALATDVDVRAEFAANERTQRKWEDHSSLPPILWSRLFFDLEPCLGLSVTDGSLLMRWFHREFGEVMRERYLSTAEDRGAIHGALAGVFHDLERELRPNDLNDDGLFRATDVTGRQVSAALRRVMEQPWQLARASDENALAEIITDFGFCMGKCAANRGADLLLDFREVERIAGDGAKGSAWIDLIRDKGHLLRRGDQSWPSHKILLQIAREQADESVVTQRGENWEKRYGRWPQLIRSDRPCVHQPTTIIAVLEGHDSMVNGLKMISSDLLLSWSEDGTIRVWNVRSGNQKNSLVAHSQGVDGVLLMKRHKLLSWSADGSIRRWDLSTGVCEKARVAHKNGVAGLIDIGDGLVVSWGTSERTMSVWQVDDMTCRSKFVVKSKIVLHSCLVAKGEVAVSCDDGTIEIWSVKMNATLRVLRGHVGAVWRTIIFRENTLISWSKDNTVCVWDVASGSCLHALDLTPTKLYVDDVRVIGDEELMILCQSWDDTYRSAEVHIWRPGQERSCEVLTARECMVEKLDVDVLGRVWCSTVAGGIRVWNRRDKTYTDLDWHHSTVSGLKFSRDIGVVTASMFGHIVVADMGSLEQRFSHVIRGDSIENIIEVRLGVYAVSGREGPIRIVCVPQDRLTAGGNHSSTQQEHDGEFSMIALKDRRFLSWSDDTTVRLWDAKTGKCKRIFRGHRKYVNGALQLATGQFVSWAGDQTIRVWDERGSEHFVIQEKVSTRGAVIELRERLFMSFSDDGFAKIWDSGSGECMRLLPDIATVLSKDAGGLMLAGGVRGNIYGIDPVDFRIVREFIGHSEEVRGIATVGGSRFLSWADGHSGDHDVRLWDGSIESCVAVFKGHSGSVIGSCALGCDRVLSWSSDSTLRVWRLDSEECLAVLRGHEGIIDGAKLLSPHLVASWGRDRSVRVWNLDSFTCVGVIRHSFDVHGVKALASGSFLSWGSVDASAWKVRNDVDDWAVDEVHYLHRSGDGFAGTRSIARVMATKLEGSELDGRLIMTWVDGVYALSVDDISLIAKWSGDLGELVSNYGISRQRVAGARGSVVTQKRNYIVVRGARGLVGFKFFRFPLADDKRRKSRYDELFRQLVFSAGAEKKLSIAQFEALYPPGELSESAVELLIERLLDAGIELYDDIR